jgi:two-component system, NtrC family, sensor histidine kinase HydH
MSDPSEPANDDNQRLLDQYHEIAALAGGLAHEIKNPLSTIVLNMELLAEDFSDAVTPRDRRALNKINVVQRECQRLQNVLDEFLNFAKVRRIKLEPADLNDEVERMLTFFQPKANEGHIEIIRFLHPELPHVLLDCETFQAVLLNLAINAQHAMPGGGQLVVRTRPIRGGVALDLIDTGAGIDEETLPHIFEAFYSTKPNGSGLGLPTAKKIVEAHGGRILVESEPGRGTMFTIALPTPRRLASEVESAGPVILLPNAEADLHRSDGNESQHATEPSADSSGARRQL